MAPGQASVTAPESVVQHHFALSQQFKEARKYNRCVAETVQST